jgi:hypothetical protein
VGHRLRNRRALVALLIGGLLAGTSMATSAVPAVILTNVGQVAEGTLSGIAPVLRLLATDGVRSIGPGPQFDVPLGSIRQITLDFPRVIIETATRTLIGPFSSFSGIPEVLRLDRVGASTITIPTSSLRAIALNGSTLRPVPRVWLGDGHLSMPEIAGAAPFVASECDNCTITPASASQSTATVDTDADLTPIWNTITPEYVPEQQEALPWWVGLLAVAALVVIAFLLTSSSAPSS